MVDTNFFCAFKTLPECNCDPGRCMKTHEKIRGAFKKNTPRPVQVCSVPAPVQAAWPVSNHHSSNSTSCYTRRWSKKFIPFRMFPFSGSEMPPTLAESASALWSSVSNSSTRASNSAESCSAECLGNVNPCHVKILTNLNKLTCNTLILTHETASVEFSLSWHLTPCCQEAASQTRVVSQTSCCPVAPGTCIHQRRTSVGQN